MIQPTPGRIVWYRPSAADLKGSSEPPMTLQNSDPLTAQVVAVHTARVVNLLVTDAIGRQYPRPYTILMQEGDARPNDGVAFAEWMPYQQGKPGEVWKKADQTDLRPMNLVDKGELAKRLQDLIDIQASPGTVDQGGYHHGMANGLILAQAIVTGGAAAFIEFKDHKQRVQIEKRELEAKLENLEPFINSAKFETLPEAAQDLLMQQHGLMIQYVKVLTDRLALM